MKHLKPMLAAFSAALLLVSCAENPGSDIVVHKDMEKLIDEAQQSDESRPDMAELQQYDTYTADFENENLRVKVSADAQVDIPQADRLSVFRVKQHDFTQEEIDRVRQALLGDTELYDGTLMTQKTKADIEPMIANARERLDAEIARVPQNADEEHDHAVMMKEWQEHLDRLQAEYEAAPFEAPKVISDGKLQNAAEMLRKGENLSYWEWQNDLGCKETIELRNADNTAVLYAQNNPNYSNKICFRTSPVGADDCSGVSVLDDPPESQTKTGVADPFIDHRADLNGVKVVPMPGDSCELSREQAEEIARNFLKAVGLADFACFEGRRYAEYIDADTEEKYYRTCWILRCCREINGVLFSQSSGIKYAETGAGEDFRKHMWPAEMVELHINDAGIVWMDWHAPVEITETVVEASALKTFPEVCSTFERMMPMIAAGPDDTDTQTNITIDRVTLSYSRISEKDNFDTGLIVPVWGFLGTRTRGWNDRFTGVQMAVNAIDGSVINAGLGY